LIGQECSFCEHHAEIGMPGEEGGDRKRLEVRPVERCDRIDLPELLERLLPRVPSERLASRSQGVRSPALDWRRQLAHRRRSYNLTGRRSGPSATWP
jgi:hypothetical protein